MPDKAISQLLGESNVQIQSASSVNGSTTGNSDASMDQQSDSGDSTVPSQSTTSGGDSSDFSSPDDAAYSSMSSDANTSSNGSGSSKRNYHNHVHFHHQHNQNDGYSQTQSYTQYGTDYAGATQANNSSNVQSSQHVSASAAFGFDRTIELTLLQSAETGVAVGFDDDIPPDAALKKFLWPPPIVEISIKYKNGELDNLDTEAPYFVLHASLWDETGQVPRNVVTLRPNGSSVASMLPLVDPDQGEEELPTSMALIGTTVTGSVSLLKPVHLQDPVVNSSGHYHYHYHKHIHHHHYHNGSDASGEDSQTSDSGRGSSSNSSSSNHPHHGNHANHRHHRHTYRHFPHRQNRHSHATTKSELRHGRYYIFPDLAIRVPGTYRLKFMLVNIRSGMDGSQQTVVTPSIIELMSGPIIISSADDSTTSSNNSMNASIDASMCEDQSDTTTPTQPRIYTPLMQWFKSHGYPFRSQYTQTVATLLQELNHTRQSESSSNHGSTGSSSDSGNVRDVSESDSP